MYSSYSTYGKMAGMGTILAIGIIGGVILSLILAAVFMPPKKRNFYKDKPGLMFLHDFLNFKAMIIGTVMKVTYIILGTVLTRHEMQKENGKLKAEIIKS